MFKIAIISLFVVDFTLHADVKTNFGDATVKVKELTPDQLVTCTHGELTKAVYEHFKQPLPPPSEPVKAAAQPS